MDKLATICATVLVVGVIASNNNKDLWNAAKNGDLDYVNTAIAKGANLLWRNQDQDGQTALHEASMFNHPAVVRALLDAGVNINQKDNNGRTPIYIASSNGSTEVVTTLIDRNADVDLQNKTGWTPLMGATLNGHLNVAEVLIKAHANVSLIDKEGYSALHVAALWNKPELARLLLENGADKDQEDNDGNTPGYLALKRGDNQLSNFINGTAKHPSNSPSAAPDSLNAVQIRFIKQVLIFTVVLTIIMILFLVGRCIVLRRRAREAQRSGKVIC